MTAREQYAKLTEEEARIKIAEYDGFMDIRYLDASGHPFIDSGLVGELLGVNQAVPNYLNDLNAMSEAVKSLPVELLKTWLDNLYLVVEGKERKHGDLSLGMVSATAAQRAEAFVLTMEAA